MDWENATIVGYLAVGGAVGTVLRYGVSRLIDSTEFPWGTFTVNFVGSFLLALLFFYFLNGTGVSTELRLFLFIGFFGAFTTMSTFTVDTVSMYIDGRLGLAAVNFLLNSIFCLLGAFIGRYASTLL